MGWFTNASLLIAERDAARADVIKARGRQVAAEHRLRDAVDANTTDHLMRGLLHDRLLVFLRDGAFDGLLITADDRTLCFADVHRRASDGTTTAAPGELYIDRTNVLYAQKIFRDQPPPT